MEIGLLDVDGAPRQEMRLLQGVATFVKVGADGLTSQGFDVMHEESLERYDEGHLPVIRPFEFFKRSTTKR